MRIKWFVAEFDRFEMGRIITAVIRVVARSLRAFDAAVSSVAAGAGVERSWARRRRCRRCTWRCWTGRTRWRCWTS